MILVHFKSKYTDIMLGNLSNVRKSLEFDIRHGVTKEQVIAFFEQLRNDLNPNYEAIRRKKNAMKRLDTLEKHFDGSVPTIVSSR